MKKLTFYKSRPADLTIVLLTNADLDVLRTFIRVQLGLGAAHLFIYFDGRLPDSKIAELQRDKRVCVRNMHEEWEQNAVKGLVNKQRFVYGDAYARCRTTWLGICDVDEFIIAEEPLADFIDRLPGAQNIVRALSSEVVWTQSANVNLPFSGRHARSALNPNTSSALLADIYGEHQDYFSAYGLLSHHQGKYIVRTGLDVEVQVHRVIATDARIAKTTGPHLTLVHHDAISVDHWLSKMDLKRKKRTRAIRSRRNQLSRLAIMNVQEKRDFFDRVFRIDESKMVALEKHGVLSELPYFWTLRIGGRDFPTGHSIFRPHFTFFIRQVIDKFKTKLKAPRA